MAKNSYGELYFIGPCNFNCYFCLGREMYMLQKDTTNMLRTHFSEWDGFYEWIDELKQDGITKIYLSSTNTEPTLYKYLDELVDLLQETHGFKVGIRSNASTLAPRNIRPVLRRFHCLYNHLQLKHLHKLQVSHYASTCLKRLNCLDKQIKRFAVPLW